jgi:hypothetical protein
MSISNGATAPNNGQATSSQSWRTYAKQPPIQQLPTPEQRLDPVASTLATVHPSGTQPINTPKLEAGGPEHNNEREKKLTRSELVALISDARAKGLRSAEWNDFLSKIREDYPSFANDAIREAIGGGNKKEQPEKDYSLFEEAITIDAMMSFDREEDPNNLVGNRWICKGYQAVLQGPTGVGKSSLILQWSIMLVLGKKFFGISAVKALRVLIIQDENDLGDVSEAFQDMKKAMEDVEELTEQDLDDLRENLIIKRVTGVRGDFSAYLKSAIERHRPDLVFVDPLFAYASGDIKEQKIVSDLLRGEINPILRDTGVALIWNHHISKPGGQANGKEESSERKKYNSFGSSEIPNTVRTVINLSEIGDGLFELHFSKRGMRAGISDAKTGNPITSINIEHSKRGIAWKLATGQRAEANKAKAKNIQAFEKVRDLIIEKKTVTQSQLRSWATTSKDVGRDLTIDFANSLSEDPEQEPRIYKYKQQKAGKGVKPTVYSIIPPITDDAFGGDPTEEAKFKASEGARREVECEFEYTTHAGKSTVTVKCQDCAEKAWAFHETKKPAGSALKRACAELGSVACKCPDRGGRFFVVTGVD